MSRYLPFSLALCVLVPAAAAGQDLVTLQQTVERPVFRQFEAEREVVVNQIRGGE